MNETFWLLKCVGMGRGKVGRGLAPKMVMLMTERRKHWKIACYACSRWGQQICYKSPCRYDISTQRESAREMSSQPTPLCPWGDSPVEVSALCDPMDYSPIRLLCPHGFSEQNSGVGCHTSQDVPNSRIKLSLLYCKMRILSYLTTQEVGRLKGQRTFHWNFYLILTSS